MKTANIADFKKHLSFFLSLVEQGETVEIRRRNIPIAQVVRIPGQRQNRTVLGCGEGSVTYHGSVTEPLIPADSWEMLTEEEGP